LAGFLTFVLKPAFETSCFSDQINVKIILIFILKNYKYDLLRLPDILKVNKLEKGYICEE